MTVQEVEAAGSGVTVCLPYLPDQSERQSSVSLILCDHAVRINPFNIHFLLCSQCLVYHQLIQHNVPLKAFHLGDLKSPIRPINQTCLTHYYHVNKMIHIQLIHIQFYSIFLVKNDCNFEIHKLIMFLQKEMKLQAVINVTLHQSSEHHRRNQNILLH